MSEEGSSGGKTDYTREEMVAKLRVDPDLAERIWRAFGFPDTPGREHGFSPDDVAAIAVFADKNQRLDSTAQLAAARAIGQSMARLAQWEAEQVRHLASDPELGLPPGQIVEAVSHIHDLVWRRHIGNLLDAGDSDGVGQEVVVGFADIVGYTALSRRLGMTELEDLLERFESAAHTIISERGGAVIKNIGDAVMFTVADPKAAAAIALELHTLTSDGELPSLSIGMALGHTLTRIGDVFGEPVNIAARLASAARPDTTLIDDDLAKALGDVEHLRVHSIPPLSVRGYRRLKAHALSPRRSK